MDTVLSVFLACAWDRCMRLSGCSYHAPAMDTVLSGYALERVFLPCAWNGHSAARVRLSECSDHVPGMDTVLSRCT